MWNSETFIQEVRRKAPPEAPPYVVNSAIEHYVEHYMAGESDVQECIALVGRMLTISQRSAPEEDQEGEKLSSFALNEVEVALTTEQKLEELKPLADGLREELFGSSEVPFPEYEDAVAWLDREFTAGKPDPSSKRDTFFEELDELTEKWGPLLSYPLKIQPERLGLTYLNPETGWIFKRPYWNQSKLPRLHAFVESVSKHTGFSEHSLVIYILSGIAPSLGHIAIGTRQFFSGRSPEVTITIRKPKITRDDLVKAYRMIQQERGKKKISGILRPTDRSIVRAMRQLGSLPPKGKGRRKKYRQDISEKLAASGTKLSSDAIRMRIGRKKLLDYV
jgi:hypothetical protein